MINDVYMIGWDEPDFEENHRRACEVLDTNVKIILGINGIHSAHKHCAEITKSDFFWCIDGDNWLYDLAKTDMVEVETTAETNSVYVMRAKNPFNGLIYGHGAMKLFPTNSFLTNIDQSSVDMTSGVNLYYKIIHRLTSEHRYNASAFHTWRTAFRECVKLSSSIIKNQNQKETDDRLRVWCNSENGKNIRWYNENHHGAITGAKWGNENYNTNKIGIINDFNKLEELFRSCYN